MRVCYYFIMQFETIDISGDVGIKAFGVSMGEAFANAAAGMYSLITDLNGVDERKSETFEAAGDSPEGLLVAWLNELVFHFDTYGFIGKRVEVTEISSRGIRAVVHGDEFDPERHERRLLIKAATYHNIRVERVNSGWEIEIIFDI